MFSEPESIPAEGEMFRIMSSQRYTASIRIILSVSALFGWVSPVLSESPPDLTIQSSHAGSIESLILIYSWSAEMGIVSITDILSALPDANTVIISQFDPATDAFTAYQSRLAGNGLGYNRRGDPRIEFIQDARPYGPWPRDQAIVDRSGTVWLSDSDQHGLKNVLPNIHEIFGLNTNQLDIAFAGSNLLVCGDHVIASERVGNDFLHEFSRQSVIRVPAPPEPAPFHLDLMVMPLSDSVIVVGDDMPVRDLFLAMSDEEITKLVLQWLTELAVSANNIKPRITGDRVAFERTGDPALILPRLAVEKMGTIQRLMDPYVFRTAVQREPDYVWDDRIASTLSNAGIRVIRVPMWPGGILSGFQGSQSPLPVITYPNLLVWEDGIIMPVYGIPELDDMTRTILEDAGKRTVYPMRGGALLGFGSSGPHCLTLEVRGRPSAG